jgi:hypothetical protein
MAFIKHPHRCSWANTCLPDFLKTVNHLKIKTGLIRSVTFPVYSMEKDDCEIPFKLWSAWAVMPRSVAVGYQCFRGPCCLPLQYGVKWHWEKGNTHIGLECHSSQPHSLNNEDGGSKVLPNAGILLQHYMVSQPRRQLESLSP